MQKSRHKYRVCRTLTGLLVEVLTRIIIVAMYVVCLIVQIQLAAFWTL